MINKLINPLLKLIFPKIEKKLAKAKQDIVEHIFKAAKLEKLLTYMEMPNDADRKIERLEEQMRMVAKDLHPPAINLKEWEDVKADLKKIRKLRVFKSLGK